MKQFKSTIAILIIFIILFAYFLLVESKNKKIEDKTVRVLSFDIEDIKSLEITDLSDNEKYSFEKDPEWIMKTPRELPVSKKVLDGILAELSDFKADRELTEKSSALGPYGLDVPKHTVKLISGNNDLYTLAIGNKNPTGDLYFVKMLDKNSIYTVASIQIDNFINRNLFYFRDKNILSTTNAEIVKIEIKMENSGEITLEKDKEGKLSVAGFSGEYLNHRIQNFVDSLTGLSAEKFIEDETIDIKAYKFNQPSYQIKLFIDKDETILLQFGKKENNSIYMKKNNEKLFYLVGIKVVTDILNLNEEIKKKEKEKQEKEKQQEEEERKMERKKEKAKNNKFPKSINLGSHGN